MTHHLVLYVLSEAVQGGDDKKITETAKEALKSGGTSHRDSGKGLGTWCPIVGQAI